MSATYAYEVRDRQGKVVTGTLEADNQAAVADRLRSMGYSPMSIKQQREGALQKELTIPGFGPKVKLKDLVIFSRQFATMINSGLSLLRALVILEEQTENSKLQEIIGQVAADVEGGRSLSDAMAEHEEFPKLFIALIRAGETAGMLDQVLMRIADTFEAELALRQKIKSAMTYPVIVFIMAIALTGVMLVFIVPTFEGLFTSLGGELPLPTQILVSMSEFVSSLLGLFLIFVVPIAGWSAFKAYRKTEAGRLQLDTIKLKLPVFGPLFHKIAITRFARNLGTLLRAGVPILQALEITSDTVNNGVIGAAVDDVKDGVRQGRSIAEPLTEHEVFPSMVVQMIAVGEETGAVDAMLDKIADFYDREVQATTEQLTALMEPLMIGVLGGIVGGMVIALYMPIFSIFELVQ